MCMYISHSCFARDLITIGMIMMFFVIFVCSFAPYKPDNEGHAVPLRLHENVTSATK